MRIIIDTETEQVIVPDSFYAQIDKINELLVKAGAGEKKIDYTQYVEDAMTKAMKNPFIRKSDLSKRR